MENGIFTVPTSFVHFYGINVGEYSILHGSVMGKGNPFFFEKPAKVGFPLVGR